MKNRTLSEYRWAEWTVVARKVAKCEKVTNK